MKKTMMMTAALLVAVVLTGCLEVANERAARDAQIGKASIDELSITIDEGLANVRALEPGRLVLWGQAPLLDMEVAVTEDGGGPWEIRLRNAMADAELNVTAADGTAITGFGDGATDLPTVKSWTLDLEGGQTYSLQVTTPDADQSERWRYAVYADVQDRIDGVQDMYDRMREDPDIRFALISGDLTEQGGTEELLRFQREMETLPFPCFATLGNHELGVNQFNFHKFFGRGNFSFEFRGVRFTLIDSASATLANRVYRWLEEDWLPAGADKLHMVMMHIPPQDPAGQRNGAFASRGEANKLLAMLARAGVDLTVYGHVHTYRAFSNAGIEAIISGGGGAIPQRLDGIGRHYLIVEADPEDQRLVTSVVRVFPEN